MTALTEGRYSGEAIMSEAPRARSRANVRVGASQTILANGLISRIARVAGVLISQVFVGTGNGVLTLADPAYGSKVKDGAYRLTCVTAAANGGVFRVEDPLGNSLGNATVGAAFNKEIKFTIADGATDFVVGDEFTLTAAADEEDMEYVAFDPAGTNGSEIPFGISIYAVTTGAGAFQMASAIVRDSELNGANIAWPPVLNAAQRMNAVQALEERGIIVRD